MTSIADPLSPIDLKSAIIPNPLVVNADLMVIDAIAQMSSVRMSCQANHGEEKLNEVHIEARSSCVVVIAESKVIGIVTERDIVRISAQQRSLSSLTVQEIMASPVITLKESELTDLFAVVNVLQQSHIRHIPIVDKDDCLLGIVTHESLRQLARPVDLLRLRLVSEVMIAEVVCAAPSTLMLSIAQLMAERRISSVLIVDTQVEHDGKTFQIPLGIITERDIVQFQSLGMSLDSVEVQVVMSTPVFSVYPEDSLMVVQQIMEQQSIGRLAVTDARGALVGVVTQTSLLQALNPIEIYTLSKLLKEKVLQLEEEKLKWMERYTTELEVQVKARTAALNAKVEREQIISKISIKIANSSHLPYILEATVQEIRDFLECDRAVIWQIPSEGRGIVVAESVGDNWRSLLHDKIDDPCFRSDIASKYSKGRAISINNVHEVGYPECYVQLLETYQIKSLLIVPIQVSSQLWGLLVVHQCDHYRQWQEDDLSLLDDMAVQIAIGIQQAMAYQQVQAEIVERQRTEANLRDSEQRFASLAAAAPVGIFRTDPEGNCLYVNERWCQIAELTASEAMGFGWVNAIHLNDRELVSAEWYTSVQENRPFNLEYRFQSQSGKITWVYGQSVSERNEMGDIIGYVGTITDISDRKTSEVNLKESEERLRLALMASNQGLYDLNIQTGEVIVSPEYATMLGYDPATFVETNAYWIERLHPDDREIAANIYQEYIAGNLPEYKVEFRQRTLSGEWKWILSLGKIVEWDEAGNPLRMLGTHTDISDRKLTEEQAQRRLDILEAARDVIASADREGRITYLNQTGKSILGIDSTTDIYNTHIPDYHPPHVAEFILQKALPQCIQQGYWSGETIFRRRDGTEFPVLQMIVCHRGSDNNVNQFSTIARDISDLKQAEKERLLSEQVRNELKLLENILDIVLAGYWDWDIPKHYEYLSPSFKQMFGYEDHEIANLPESWQQLIFPEDLPKAIEAFERHVQSHGEIPYYNEVRYRHKDGSTVWVICSGQVIEWDSEGNPIRMIGCHIDISDRKHIEEQLRLSKEELERFFSVALDLLCIADMEGNFCRLNRSWESTLGYTLAELEGKRFLSFIHPDDIAATLEVMSALSEQKAVIAFVNRYRCKDGTYRYIEWYARPYGNSIYAAARDITKRKYAEDEILEKQRFIQKIADASPNILYLYDLQEHRNVYCNREIASVLGYTAAEVQAMGADLFVNLMHPDDLARIYGYYQRINAAQDGDIFDLEYRMRHADGEYRWLYSRDSIFSRDEQGRPKQTIGTAQDISDRKQAEAALRNLSDRLTLAVKSAAIGIWDWDVSQNVLRWDDRMYELYGLKPEQFANAYEAWASTLHPEDRINTENAIQQALRGEKEYDPEFRVVLPDGTSRFIKAYSLVQRNQLGEPLRMVGINFDISDRKQAEALIQQTSAQLEASNRELEAFAYSVSHDLRAPLRAIDGFSNALMEDYADKFDQDGRDYFERIRRNIQRMGMLIDDLLRLSRVSRSEMQYSNVNLSSLVQEQIRELQESDPQRQVEAVIAPEIIVSADVTLMRVIISNLIQNAWKFTSHHATARIEFGTIEQNEQAVYFIRDDGAGFDMNYTKMLFGVFQRLHNTNEFPGTGIGLATVQRVIHRHGGKVWAEGEVEKGATIYFTLPNNPIRI